MSRHDGTIWIRHCLARQENLGSSKVARRVHLLQDAGHALLSLLFFFHLCELAPRDRCLLISLLKLFVRQEVLGHDARDLLEVIKHGKSRILLPLIWRTESAEFVIGVQSY